jgi:hypothetical protein
MLCQHVELGGGEYILDHCGDVCVFGQNEYCFIISGIKNITRNPFFLETLSM